MRDDSLLNEFVVLMLAEDIALLNDESARERLAARGTVGLRYDGAVFVDFAKTEFDEKALTVRAYRRFEPFALRNLDLGVIDRNYAVRLRGLDGVETVVLGGRQVRKRARPLR